uniref:(California timema) hypothetical protein n=1 Tax=Timema californicum TaxID=61474 RepID=A0A7R9PBV6_TIMCA|nr:unnamed protein product [Timema californicum]
MCITSSQRQRTVQWVFCVWDLPIMVGRNTVNSPDSFIGSGLNGVSSLLLSRALASSYLSQESGKKADVSLVFVVFSQQNIGYCRNWYLACK